MKHGKLTQGYVEDTSTRQLRLEETAGLGLKHGDCILPRRELGLIEIDCQGAKAGGTLPLPEGDS
jgi:hypothetical protein